MILAQSPNSASVPSSNPCQLLSISYLKGTSMFSENVSKMSPMRYTLYVLIFYKLMYIIYLAKYFIY